jgi:LacI family transcriptional regulator, gluconate utilization system Gnt-I transcriptional repressor
LRRIAYIGSELDKDLCARRRYRALQSTLSTEGIELISVICETGPRQAETGRLLAKQLIEAHPDIEAIHFLNDAMALGGLSYLHEEGISVPDSVSVVGFNGTSLANAVRTRLTTIDMPRTEIGAIAARALLQMLSGERVQGSWRARLQVVQGNTTRPL